MKITEVRLRTVTGRMDAARDKCSFSQGQRHRVPMDVILGCGAPFTKIAPQALNADGTVTKSTVFLYIETDEGITGVAGPLSVPFPQAELKRAAGLLRGADPFDTARVWELMYRMFVQAGSRELKIMGAVDIALWDIKCRALRVPLNSLLGGRIQKTLPLYASSVGEAYTGSGYDLERVAEYTRETVRDGYVGAKWWIHRGPSDGEQGVRDMEALVRTVRESAGPDYKIMLDCWCGWTYEYAMRVCRRISDYDIYFLEEPLMPEQSDLSARLSRECPVRIALGEHLTVKYDFLRHLTAGFRGIFQPDPFWMGGITPFLQVMGLITAFDQPATLHGSCLPLCAQLAPLYPINVVPVSEYLVNMADALQYFYKYPVTPLSGTAAPSLSAGCQLDVDEAKVERDEWLAM